MSYWIFAGIYVSYMVFWFAITQSIGPHNMRPDRKLCTSVVERYQAKFEIAKASARKMAGDAKV